MEDKPLSIYKYFNKILFALVVFFAMVNVTTFARTIILAESEVIEASNPNLDVAKTPIIKKKYSGFFKKPQKILYNDRKTNT